MTLDGFGRALELLEKKHLRLDLAKFSFEGTISLYARANNLNLYIDVDRYMKDKKLVNWLYHFSNWIAYEEVVFYFRGAEHKVELFEPITVSKELYGTSSDPFKGDGTVTTNLTPLIDLRLFTPEDREVYRKKLNESFSCIRLQVDSQYAEEKGDRESFYEGIDKSPQKVTIKFLSSQSPYAMEISEVEKQGEEQQDSATLTPV